MFSVCRGRKVRVVCRQRSTEGKRIRKEEEELEEDSTTSQSVIRKRRSPPKQICLIFPEERHAKRHRRATDGADKREGGRRDAAAGPNKRQTRSSSDAAGRTRTRAHRPVRAERDSVSLSRAGREEDSAAQVKSGAGSVLSVASQCRACCRFCQEKGRTVSRKNRATHLPSPYLCFTPSPCHPTPLRIHIFGDRRGEERAVRRARCSVKRRGGRRRVQVVDDSLAKFIASDQFEDESKGGGIEQGRRLPKRAEEFFCEHG